MSGVTRARAVLLTLASSLSVTGLARAQPVHQGVSPPFQLAYDAPPDVCPNAIAFFGAIRARTERARLARPGEPAVAIGVRIKALRGGSVVGRVEIREPDGVGQERTVESASCKEVAQALALVIALYLDPDATTGAMPETEPESEPAPPPSPEPARRRRPRSNDVVPPPPHPSHPSHPPQRAALALAAGVGAGAAGGIGPSVGLLARAFGEITIDGASIVRPMSWARPSLRLLLDFATTSSEVAAGSQTYVLVAGGLRLCPVDVALGRGIFAGPCAGMQAGVHRGTSAGVPNARDQDKPWLSPLGTAHALFPVAERLTVELEAGVVVPLVRTRYFLGPDVTLFRTPDVAGVLSAAVAYRFR